MGQLEKVVSSFERMSPYKQSIHLSKWLKHISLAARNTYEAGTDGVEQPADLRTFNEILHRTASFQLDIVLDWPRRSNFDFFSFLAEALGRLGYLSTVFKDVEREN